MMSSLLIMGELLLTMDPENRTIERGAVYVEGGRIVALGEADKLRANCNADLVIEEPESLIVPGLINCHVHFNSSLIRGLIDDLGLEEWDEEIPPPPQYGNRRWRHLATRLVLLEMVKAGVTSYADGSGDDEDGLKERYESGLRGFLSIRIMDEVEDFRALLQLVRERYGDRLRLMLGPWWVSKVPREVLEEVGEVAKRYGLKVRIHAAETEREVKEIRRKYGCKGSIDYLREVGLVGPNLVAVHCVHLTPEEIGMLKEYDVKVVHCPTSNAKLGDGIAPLVELLKAGVTVGLGTDGMATNNCVDMFAEMKLACLLQRAIHKDPHVIGANTVLRMATVWAAKVLGDERIGSLEVGKRADLITLDLGKPHFHPRTDIISHLVYSAKPADVRTVIVEGQVIMRDRRVLTLDEAGILKGVQEFLPEYLDHYRRS